MGEGVFNASVFHEYIKRKGYMYDDGGGKTRKKKKLKYSFSMVNLPNIQKRVWLNILLQKDI